MKNFTRSILVLSAVLSGFIFTSQSQASTVICHTAKNGGNFSILVGTLTETGFTGTLTRGINDGRFEATNAQFEITATPVGTPTNMTISFDVPQKIVMPAPYNDIEWKNINLTFQKSLLHRGRGGLIEKGVLENQNISSDYQMTHMCVVRQ